MRETGVAAVDQRSQLIAEAQAHGARFESELLLPVVQALLAQLVEMTVITADANNHSESNLQQLHAMQDDALIADNDLRRRDERCATQARYRSLPNPLHNTSAATTTASVVALHSTSRASRNVAFSRRSRRISSSWLIIVPAPVNTSAGFSCTRANACRFHCYNMSARTPGTCATTRTGRSPTRASRTASRLYSAGNTRRVSAAVAVPDRLTRFTVRAALIAHLDPEATDRAFEVSTRAWEGQLERRKCWSGEAKSRSEFLILLFGLRDADG